MTKITDIPAIRFKGFSDTWEQRKVRELFKVWLCTCVSLWRKPAKNG